MKKKSMTLGLFALLLMAALLSSCASTDDIMNKYADLISEEPTEKSAAEVEKYVDDNIDKLDTRNADYMLQLMDDFTYRYDENGLDYRELANKYKDCISKTLFDFYIIKANEQDTPAVKDGILQRDFEGLMLRALELEAFMDANKDAFRGDHYKIAKEDLVWIYESYISLMMKGSSVNPVFSYETGEVTEPATASYAALAAAHSDTVTAWAAEEFLQYVDDVGGRLDYEDTAATKLYYDTCAYINSESGKKLLQ